MQVITDRTRINILEYDCIISLGNKCPTATILRDLQLYKESYPFDSIPTTAAHIYKYIVDDTNFYPIKGAVFNKDGVWFGHFDVNDEYENTLAKFKRRFERFYNNLMHNRRILFVYTSEGDCFNEMGNRFADNYGELCKIRDHILDKYKYDNFTILAIHTNKQFINDKNIINYTINVNKKYINDDIDTFIKNGGMDLYRKIVRQLFKQIFGCEESEASLTALRSGDI